MIFTKEFGARFLSVSATVLQWFAKLMEEYGWTYISCRSSSNSLFNGILHLLAYKYEVGRYTTRHCTHQRQGWMGTQSGRSLEILLSAWERRDSIIELTTCPEVPGLHLPIRRDLDNTASVFPTGEPRLPPLYQLSKLSLVSAMSFSNGV